MKAWKERGKGVQSPWGSENSSSDGTSEEPAHCCWDGGRGN